MKTDLKRSDVIRRLQRASVELRALGCEHLALFGSVARNEDGLGSDLDFAAIYDGTRVQSLLDMGGVAARIEEALGTDNFDLADERSLRPAVKEQFEKEHVRLF